MIRFYFLLLLFFTTDTLFAQVSGDSLKPVAVDTVISIQDTSIHETDSAGHTVIPAPVPVRPTLDSAWKARISPFIGQSFRELVFKGNPFFAFSATAFIARSDIKEFNGKEFLFYMLIALLLVFAVLRMIFPKYLNDLFRLFFRRTLKQRQITEQLSQTPLPSLVLNSFFMVTAGLYTAFLLQHYSFGNQVSFLLLALYSSAGLAIMYLIKFLSLKFTGWVLNLSAATDSYIFIVFIINKVIGIFLLPFLVLLAFAQGDVYQLALTLSFCGIAGLFVYRFILSYSAVHNQIRVKPFHFILYLFAFEIVPLLLIYKLLLYFLF